MIRVDPVRGSTAPLCAAQLTNASCNSPPCHPCLVIIMITLRMFGYLAFILFLLNYKTLMKAGSPSGQFKI